jgi:ABC-type sugar transport system ATPase subunit
MSDEFIKFSHITKRFAGGTALDDVSITIARGETHALMGENGAGKSTLGKTLAGIHRPDSGSIRIAGVVQQIRSPCEAMKAGIGMVHQELAFCPDLSIAENLVLGTYPTRGRMFLSRGKMRRRAKELLGQIGASLDVNRPMRSLSTAQEQLVQIASAVGTGARVLIFDEPTSSLSEPEARALFGLMDRLRARGVTMIYVSHRMPEVFRLCDRISVLRDGRCVGSLPRAEATQDSIVRMMIGRSLAEYFPQHLSAPRGLPTLRLRGLSSPGKFHGIGFDVHAGEIVGLAGLVGAGRSEIAAAIFGLDRAAVGSIEVDGTAVPLGFVRASMRAGIGLVPEDRKRQGLVLGMGVRPNFSLAMLDRLRRMLVLLDRRREKRDARQFMDRLRVRTPTLDTPVAGLSGGNQQKVLLAKWLARGGRVLIVDEPTRGVDVGAKAAIHALIDELARQGTAIILISSELPEVLNLSTRILVMRGGRMVAQLARGDATQDHLLRLMAGVTTPEAHAA